MKKFYLIIMVFVIILLNGCAQDNPGNFQQKLVKDTESVSINYHVPQTAIKGNKTIIYSFNKKDLGEYKQLITAFKDMKNTNTSNPKFPTLRQIKPGSYTIIITLKDGTIINSYGFNNKYIFKHNDKIIEYDAKKLAELLKTLIENFNK